MSRLKVGINGFGRIGRCLLRLGLDELDIVVINSLAPIEMVSHLLKYDSVHGPYSKEVRADKDCIRVGKKQIPYVSYKHPKEIPWHKWQVDIVLECAGVFKKREDLEAHLKGGAKKVFVAAPIPDDDLTLIYGINHLSYQPSQHHIISNGSCTANCLAPLIKVLHEKFQLEEVMFTTIHSYTLDQNLLDSSHKKDVRRARSANLNMIPTSTGATSVLARIFPDLKDKINGMSIRVPTPNVSLVDVVIKPKNEVGVEEIHKAFLQAEKNELKGILFCESNKLVSTDFNGSTYSAIVDLPSTMKVKGHLVKILAWYDNEIGFSKRMIDFVQYLSGK